MIKFDNVHICYKKLYSHFEDFSVYKETLSIKYLEATDRVKRISKPLSISFFM